MNRKRVSTRRKMLLSRVRQTMQSTTRGVVKIWNAFLIQLAPLYGILKAFTVVIVVQIAIGLFVAYIVQDLSLTLAPPILEFIVARFNDILTAFAFILVVALLASIGNRRNEKEELLRASFRLCKLAEDLKLSDFGLTLMADRKTEALPLEQRPFFGKYFERTATTDEQ